MSLPPTRVPDTPYRRPRPVAADSLLLDGNEGSVPEAALLAELARRPATLLREYPDLSRLEARIARRHGVEVDRVLVTDGADGAMDRLFRAYLEPGRELVVPVPTFEMIHRFAATCGADVVTVPWTDGFPLAEITGRLGPRTALVAVVSPNNPTGAVLSAAELDELAGRAAAVSALVLLDHVYAEYADVDLTAGALEHANVVVLRTFSKAWGLAGCRVGYALGSAGVIATLRNAGNPYPVSALSASVALRRLDEGGESVRRHVEAVRDERERLTAWLCRRGVPAPRSQGNFLIADFGRRAGFVRRALAERGVTASLEEVTSRFQSFYLGGARAPGLRERERLLVPVERLAAWAGRLPLAVVTGRPRAEAEWFLEREGLAALVSVLVAQEDAPAKPDPAPVRLALERLGVERGWMLGDTPDDLAAALAAGAVPLAVAAPGDEGPETTAALEDGGAAAVLERATDLEDLL